MNPDLPLLVVVSPRFAEGATVGGAETLLRETALDAAHLGYRVLCLATCARDHFTWANAIPPGRHSVGPLEVECFLVDTQRDSDTFHRLQQSAVHGRALAPSEEADWLRHGICSTTLLERLAELAPRAHRILVGPYLFALTIRAAAVAPGKTLLVPCLHDEPFARLGPVRALFASVRGCLFNAPAERELAERLFGLTRERSRVVGMGLDPFPVERGRFRRRHGMEAPYLMYAGRREPLKGTPLMLDYLNAFRLRTHRDIRLVLAGTGPIEPPDALAPHIVNLGFASETDKHDAMADALAFCHPSVNESFGIVALEAWLAGTPILVHGKGRVLSDHCQRSGGGLWFRNYPEFEELLVWLLDHPEERGQLGAQGRAYTLSNYSRSAIREKLREALVRL